MVGTEGGNVFKANDYFFWIPLVMPHIGALIGAAVYYFGIEMWHKEKPILD